jgi:F-type H+-transporting ATPase subunit alpha
MPAGEQVAVLLAATRGLLDRLPLEKMGAAQRAIIRMVRSEPRPVEAALAAAGSDAAAWTALVSRIEAVVKPLEDEHAGSGVSEQKDPHRP